MKTIVTSALPYVNNIPHLGNMVCIISADIYTRFLKQTNAQVISVLGTDEHGTTTETVALQKNMTCKEVVDHYYKIHKEIYEWFDCTFDCFGRTSSKENHEIAKDLFLKLYENGFVEENEIDQYFDEKHQKFLSDRFIEGTCPNCGYTDARGDQCDKCQKLLNPTDLINPKSKLSNETPTLKKTKHLYIKLDKLQKLLQTKLDMSTWSQNAINTTNAWFKEGLKPRAITRDLKWGVQVPLKGYENKVFYVWFDAPIGYISITKQNIPNYRDWWNKDTNLVQFMGKDNIPFHSIIFPSILIGSKETYGLIKTLNANEYLNYENKKISKSRGVGIFADQVKNLDIQSDVWRYYITINRPEKTDTNFYWKDFQEKNNTELVANLGNLVNRTFSFTKKFFDSKIPKLVQKEDYQKKIENIKTAYSKIELKKALKLIMNLSKDFNAYFQQQEPWKKIKEDPQLTGNIIANLHHMIKDLAILIHPVMPKTAQKICAAYNINKTPNYDDLQLMPSSFTNIKPLFRKLEDEEIELLSYKFSGDLNLNLVVGQITNVVKHPKADKLYIEQVDLGTEKRQIVSGLVGQYTPEQLINKKVIIVTNLKPAKLRGELSQGMLLAAESDGNVSVLTTKLAVGAQLLKSQAPINIEEFSKIKLEFKKDGLYINNSLLDKEIESDKKILGKVK